MTACARPLGDGQFVYAFYAAPSCDQPVAQVVRLNDGRFQVIRDGPLPIILAGYQHVLVAEEFLKRLWHWNVGGFEASSATIFDRPTGEQWDHYYELKIAEEITPDNISSANTAGLHVWHYDHSCLFVSPELKARLDGEDLALKFSEDFSRFAG